jgi:hypothetical protein
MELYDLSGKSRRELLEIAQQYEWMLASIRAHLIAVHHRLFMLTEEMDILPDTSEVQRVELTRFRMS